MKKNFIITLVAILATSSIALADFSNFNPLSKLKVVDMFVIINLKIDTQDLFLTNVL